MILAKFDIYLSREVIILKFIKISIDLINSILDWLKLTMGYVIIFNIIQLFLKHINLFLKLFFF